MMNSCLLGFSRRVASLSKINLIGPDVAVEVGDVMVMGLPLQFGNAGGQGSSRWPRERPTAPATPAGRTTRLLSSSGTSGPVPTVPPGSPRRPRKNCCCDRPDQKSLPITKRWQSL